VLSKPQVFEYLVKQATTQSDLALDGSIEPIRGRLGPEIKWVERSDQWRHELERKQDNGKTSPDLENIGRLNGEYSTRASAPRAAPTPLPLPSTTRFAYSPFRANQEVGGSTPPRLTTSGSGTSGRPGGARFGSGSRFWLPPRRV
jgi:hypothetical protein